MILVTGRTTTIVQSIELLRPEEHIEPICKRPGSDEVYDFTMAPPGARIVLAGGLLLGLNRGDHTADTYQRTMRANFEEPIAIIQQAIGEIPGVRICVIGSQSAELGSYDEVYAQAKLKLHRMVGRIAVGRDQQLVCVAPPIIADSGMTRRRHDYPQVLRERSHCHSMDVARVVVDLLWEDPIRHNNSVTDVLPTVVPACAIETTASEGEKHE